jgi:alpha-tubulin suppressor-like RCC1 family protein
VDPAVDATVVHDAASEAPSPAGCNPACAPDQFCGMPSGTCISAVAQVAAGSTHTCAVHRDGRVSCWGYGPFIAPGLPPVVTPPQVIALDGPAAAVAVGIQAACALLRDGTVDCWGDLGQGVEPAQKVVREDHTLLGGVTQIAGGSLAFCGVTAAGVHCWGDNASGELARPTSMKLPPRTAVLARPGPAPVLAATVAILVHDGGAQLCGWGNNDSGIAPGAREILTTPSCAGDIPQVLQLGAGDGHVCARRGGATFSCWGNNAGGQLGIDDENVLEAPLPGAMRDLPGEIRTIAAGAYHTCALLANGTVSCWGNNDFGQCALRSSAPLFGPRTVDDLAGVAAIGSGAGAQHTCVVMTDGSVRCWGYDDDGQLGTGATTPDDNRYDERPTPVRW